MDCSILLQIKFHLKKVIEEIGWSVGEDEKKRHEDTTSFSLCKKKQNTSEILRWIIILIIPWVVRTNLTCEVYILFKKMLSDYDNGNSDQTNLNSILSWILSCIWSKNYNVWWIINSSIVKLGDDLFAILVWILAPFFLILVNKSKGKGKCRKGMIFRQATWFILIKLSFIKKLYPRKP